MKNASYDFDAQYIFKKQRTAKKNNITSTNVASNNNPNNCTAKPNKN